MAFYRGVGRRPVRVNKELPGHVVNRLQAALYREVVYLVTERVISVADIDDMVSWGPGLRWGIMGPNMLFHLSGGPRGIEHFFQQFTGPINTMWKALGNIQLTPERCKIIIDGVHAEAGSRSIQELSDQRDEVLLGLLKLRQ